MNKKLFLLLSLMGVLSFPIWAADRLADEFVNPPAATMPRCYWYWMNGQISREGITKDLEAMKRVGIGEAHIGVIYGGGAKTLSEEWWAMIDHAVREGTRLGVDIGLFNCPGWSQSGGPWVKPEQAMRHIVQSETRLQGPQAFSGKLSANPKAVQELAVLAFPAPAQDSDTAESQGAVITRSPKEVRLAMPKPFTARSLTIQPAKAINVTATLQASDDGVTYRTVRTLSIDRSNLGLNLGPVPLAPFYIAFPPTSAPFFRVTFSGDCDPGELTLSGAPRLEALAEKSLMKMFQGSQAPFDYYRWAPQAESESSTLAINPATVINLSAKMVPDGTLTWNVPAGDWIVLRTGLAPTGVVNTPAPSEATGFEIDKMSRPALKTHFDAYVGKLLARIPAKERKSWKHVIADSYEVGPQNWTDGMQADFQIRYGYDPLLFLPVLTGRIVGSPAQSDRFLWDLRRLVADRISKDYVGGMRDLCNASGLKTWLQNYGHWGFPGEFLQYGGNCDEISGEFWEGNGFALGAVELRPASSAAHIYGKKQVFAEAFTGGPRFTSTPWSLKKRGDWAYCQGINQYVLHVYIHQPWDDRLPGMNTWFGTEFNRNNTWFEASKTWIDYQRRCSVLLQQGQPVADVAYFIGEDAPRVFGARNPELPSGYDFDYINAEVLMTRATAKDGRLVLASGSHYKLLVLPAQDTMTPELLAKIAELARAGVAVYGPRPVRSPSLKNFPACDQRVEKLAAELWDKGLIQPSGDLKELLNKIQTPPDLDGVDFKNILFTHRRTADADIYFLSNQSDAPVDIIPSFRVIGRAPELWHPENGLRERLAIYEIGKNTTRVPLRLESRGSVFVVFRGKAAVDHVINISRNGELMIQPQKKHDRVVNTFSLALWVKPTADTTLVKESNDRVSGMAEPRNDAIYPPHGENFAPGDNQAGCGLAVGRNGVCVFEHGARYFAPVLVHEATLSDWTHVAVVYRDGQPSLYLNGVLARTGMKSEHIVNPGTPTSTGPVPFQGELGTFRQASHALTQDEVASWLKTMPCERQEQPSAAAFLRDESGKLIVRTRLSGTYEILTADGKNHSLTVLEPPAPKLINGKWDVSFPGISAPVQFTELASWTTHSNSAVKYFSGTAVYRTSFEAPAVEKGDRVMLDLGRVESLAEVTLNGRNLGWLWKPPFRLDVTETLKTGSNVLEVKVVNTWHNRLVGQKQEPEAFSAPDVFKPWLADNYDPGKDLKPAGLIGPVQLLRNEEGINQ